MLITTVFRNLLRIYIRANTRKVTLLILHGDLMFSPQMKDRTIKIEVLLFSAKISLTNAVLVLYGVAFAAVPVLVAYGKAGVKGCDFVVIIHVHILLCVHVEFFTLKIMHSIGQIRIPRLDETSCGFCLSYRPPA